jgi:hypothetical protein
MSNLIKTIDFCKTADTRDVTWTKEIVVIRRAQMKALEQYILGLLDSNTGKQIDINVHTTHYVLNAVVTIKITAPGNVVERCIRYFAALGY